MDRWIWSDSSLIRWYSGDRCCLWSVLVAGLMNLVLRLSNQLDSFILQFYSDEGNSRLVDLRLYVCVVQRLVWSTGESPCTSWALISIEHRWQLITNHRNEASHVTWPSCHLNISCWSSWRKWTMNSTLKVLLHCNSNSTCIGNQPYGSCGVIALVRRRFDPSIGPRDLLQSHGCVERRFTLELLWREECDRWLYFEDESTSVCPHVHPVVKYCTYPNWATSRSNAGG